MVLDFLSRLSRFVMVKDPRHLWARYGLGLLLIAGLVSLSHLSISRAVESRISDASVINESGRQRMLTQRILYLSNVYAEGQEPTIALQLNHAITQFQDAHARLVATSQSTKSLHSLYGDVRDPDSINAKVARFSELARQIVSSPVSERQTALQILNRDGQTDLLQDLEGVVAAFEAQAKNHDKSLAKMHEWALVAALFVILLEVVIVFWPAQRVTMRAMAKLEEQVKRERYAHRRLKSFTEIAADLLWETDIEGRIIFFNGRMVSQIVSDPEMVIGQHYLDVIRLSAGQMAHMAEAIQTASAYRGILTQFTDQTGRRYIFRIDARPNYDADGKITGYIGVGSDVTQRLANQRKMAHLAQRDSLTGLANRHTFTHRMNTLFEDGLPDALSLLAIDLDGFKAVNDTYGHDVGDALLQQFAGRIGKSIRGSDWAARLGGDEFVIVCEGVSEADRAELVAARLLKSLAQPYLIKGIRLEVNASIGIAMTPDHGTTADELVKNADLALYRAKSSGKGQYVSYHQDLRAELDRRQLLEERLRLALLENSLSLVYQPLIDLRSGQVTGFEALARWQDEVLGTVSPVEFIPLAEEAGLIQSLGEQVLRKACFAAADWQSEVQSPCARVNVNISPAQFRNASLLNLVEDCLTESGLHPSNLELEITETLLLDNVDATRQMLQELKALGVSIAIDDFGAGYSSLGRLNVLPFDRLKIDRSIISELATSPESRKIVTAIIQLGNSLGVRVVAEGIEQQMQLQALRETGCHEAQGYFLCRPIEEVKTIDLLLEQETIAA